MVAHPVLHLILCLLFIPYSNSAFTFNRDYERHLVQYPCIRIFTSDGSLGCHSPNTTASSGVLIDINRYQDGFDIDFVAVVSGEFFNDTILAMLVSSGHLAGLIVYDQPNTDDTYLSLQNTRYSSDVQTPQGVNTPGAPFSIDPSYPWNPFGNGILQKLTNFPIVRAEVEEIPTLLQLCTENHENGYMAAKVHSAEMSFYMGKEALTSLDCLNWKDIQGKRSPECQPIGGESIWATLDTLDKRPKIILTVSFDSTAEFHDIASGANDAMSSLATALIVAESLSRVTSILNSQPLIFLANADEWGFSGSRRFVRDLWAFECDVVVDHHQSATGLPICLSPMYPSNLFKSISLSEIDIIIAIDQIGILAEDEALYLHHLAVYVDNNDAADTEETEANTVEMMLTVAKQSDTNLVDTPITKGGAIPPTPLTSFINGLNDLQSSGSFVALLLSGYGQAFVDPSYHTRLDTVKNPQVMVNNILKVSNLVVSTIYKLAGGDGTSPEVNEATASDIFDCLYKNWTCAYFKPYYDSEIKNILDYVYDENGFIISKGSNDDTFSQVADWDFSIDSTIVNTRRNITEVLSYYTGPLSKKRQPVAMIGDNMYGRLSLDTLWERNRESFSSNLKQMTDFTWDPVHNKVFLFPSTIESILRPFLSFHLSNDRRSTELLVSCNFTLDCGYCSIMSYPAVQKECIRNTCICPSASYHLALDIGLEADEMPGRFTTVAIEAIKLGGEPTPMYCESNWDNNIGVRIYTVSSPVTGIFALIIGFLVATFSIASVCYVDDIMKVLVI